MSEKRMLTGILIDPEHDTFGVRTIEDTLPNLYDLLHCDLIDITERVVGDTPVSIICDDEGLLRDDPWVSAWSPWTNLYGYRPELCGALFVIGPGVDGSGNLLSLSKEAQDAVLKHIRNAVTHQSPELRPRLFDVHYFAGEED